MARRRGELSNQIKLNKNKMFDSLPFGNPVLADGEDAGRIGRLVAR